MAKLVTRERLLIWIGEAVVIILSVLAAFSLDSWRQDSQLHSSRLELLSHVETDVQLVERFIDAGIRARERALEATNVLLANQVSDASGDSLGVVLATALLDSDVPLALSISEAPLGLSEPELASLSLRVDMAMIARAHDNLRRVEGRELDFLAAHLRPYVHRHVVMDLGEGERDSPAVRYGDGIAALMDDPIFRNLLIERQRHARAVLESYRATSGVNRRLMETIGFDRRDLEN